MVGAGLFSAIGPATSAAGSWILVALAGAALVATCNALSSAQLAVIYPRAGGTYVYGGERLGRYWGYLAGWGFLIGKTASCAAIALTFGFYVSEQLARPLAAAAVISFTLLNLLGIDRTARVAALLLVPILATLSLPVITAIGMNEANLTNALPTDGFPGLRNLFQASALLFFAFAGYARITTLGEEIVDPGRTIPRAISIALATAVVIYALVVASALAVLGPLDISALAAPLADTVKAGPLARFSPAIQAGATIASLGVLISLLAAVSRMGLAMARNRDLPFWFGAVHSRFHVPHRAELVIGLTVVILVSTLDLRNAIGFSSFAVLIYYAIANASALTLPGRERRLPILVPLVGIVGCIVLAASLPLETLLAGMILFAAGTALYVAASIRRTA